MHLLKRRSITLVNALGKITQSQSWSCLNSLGGFMIDIEWVAANAITRDANNVDELASKRTKVAAPHLVATNVR